MAFANRRSSKVLGVVSFAWIVLGGCDGVIGLEPADAPPATTEAALVQGAVCAVPVAAAPAPADNGACMSNADCPADYPHCCQVGGYASCFEESCEDVGGTPKRATTATAR